MLHARWSLLFLKGPGVKICPETRQRVIQVANQMDYVPEAAAQALIGQRAQTYRLRGGDLNLEIVLSITQFLGTITVHSF